MALIRSTSDEEDSARTYRRLPETFPHHPTLQEIAQRQREIETWEMLSVASYRFAKPGAIISFLVTATAVFLVLTPVPPNWPWDVPLSIMAIFSAVAMVVCGLLWLDKPDNGPRPEPLRIAPFSPAENLHLMSEQTTERYRATCGCPGCGEVATHLMRKPADSEPTWAAVTRQCRVCARQWSQE